MSCPRAGCGNLHVRFDERDVETEHGLASGAPAETKGPAAEMPRLHHRATSRLYMKTPPNMARFPMHGVCGGFEAGTICRDGVLGCAGTWSRGPSGDATVKAHMGTAHEHGAPCPAPRSHPSAKADGTCSALRGTRRSISGHLRHAALVNSHGYWLRGSSHNWLGARLAIIPSPT